MSFKFKIDWSNPEKVKAYDRVRNKIYRERNKDKIKAHFQRPEVKAQKRAYMKNYLKSQNGKNIRKKYYERESVKVAMKINMKRFNAKRYGRTLEEYNQITKECIICGFDKTLDLHHIDGNINERNCGENNNINNQIGLCPNHHKMIHLKNYKVEILKTLQNLTKNNLIQTALVKHQINVISKQITHKRYTNERNKHSNSCRG